VAAGAAVNVETIMDSLNSDGSGALALEPLCQAAAQELLMRSYTIRTLNRYKRVWEQLADFARAQGQPALYSRELALGLPPVVATRSDRSCRAAIPNCCRCQRENALGAEKPSKAETSVSERAPSSR
jgi:hypothetical protein